MNLGAMDEQDIKWETRTVLFVDIFASTEVKRYSEDTEWTSSIIGFYKMVYRIIGAHNGEIVKLLGDAVMACFVKAENAISAAIDIQETADEDRKPFPDRLFLKIGIATGVVCIFSTPDGKTDYLGTPVDLAARLTAKARGSAILLCGTTYHAADLTNISAKAGIEHERKADEYFEQHSSNTKIKGFGGPVKFYEVFWQEIKIYIGSDPVESAD